MLEATFLHGGAQSGAQKKSQSICEASFLPEGTLSGVACGNVAHNSLLLSLEQHAYTKVIRASVAAFLRDSAQSGVACRNAVHNLLKKV